MYFSIVYLYTLYTVVVVVVSVGLQNMTFLMSCVIVINITVQPLVILYSLRRTTCIIHTMTVGLCFNGTFNTASIVDIMSLLKLKHAITSNTNKKS